MTLHPLSDVIILLCLASDPTTCERTVIPLDASLLECVTTPTPPAEVLQLLQARQAWKIKSIQCRLHAVDL